MRPWPPTGRARIAATASSTFETVDAATPARLARLGVVASVQPVHSDPAIQENWRAMLGDARVERAYPWGELADAGATLALGTDAPTAPYDPLPNLYIAATRRSATDGDLPANLPGNAMAIADAVRRATRDAAYASRWDGELGVLRQARRRTSSSSTPIRSATARPCCSMRACGSRCWAARSCTRRRVPRWRGWGVTTHRPCNCTTPQPG